MDSEIVVIIIVFCVFQFLFSSAVVDSKSITLSLSRQKHSHSSSSSIREELQRLVRASSARAQSFQHSKLTTTSAVVHEDNIDIPLFPRPGMYSLSLSFGTPPQSLPFLMDTGSSLTWFPCTDHFKCDHCKSKGMGPIQPFIPKESSSSRNVSCNSTQCKWLFPDPKCTSQKLHCGYNITYGKGGAAGLLLSEFLTFPDVDDKTRLYNFTVGCSRLASYMPSGIVGFGRARYSLPAQMELDAFSYCLVSHDLDDNKTMSSDLILITKLISNGSTGGIVHYTPLIHNQIQEDFYYVRLQNIIVGNVNITVLDGLQIPDADGKGGTIMDSGTTLTVMEESVFNSVAYEFERQVIGKNSSNSRNITAENETGLGLCLNVWSLDDIPTLSLLFQGGVLMDLPKKNYFLYIEYKVVCALMISPQAAGIKGIPPAIILGNYFQQNFNVEFDLKNSRLGLLKRICSAK